MRGIVARAGVCRWLLGGGTERFRMRLAVVLGERLADTTGPGDLVCMLAWKRTAA